MKILFLSRWYPYPPNNGSKLRVYNLLLGLTKYHDVSLLSFAEPSEISVGLEKPPSTFKKIHIIPRKPFNPQSKRARIGFLGKTPRSFIDTFSPELVQNIEQTLITEKPDLVIASQIDMAAYGQYFKHLPSLFEEAEVGVLFEQFKKTKSLIKRLRYWLTWAKHQTFLATILENFNAATVVSQQEYQLLSHAVQNHPPIQVIPNGVDLSSYQEFNTAKNQNTIIFTGAFSYDPNYEAMEWFIREVFPLILEKVPEAQLIITGDHKGRPLPSLNNVTLAGFVDDVRPLIASSMCSVVPIFSGGGTRLKILEAMALGTPVVASTKGAEGLELKHNQDILIVDHPQDFANALVSLLSKPGLRRKLAENALQQVQTKYDWQVIMPDFLKLVDQIIELS